MRNINLKKCTLALALVLLILVPIGGTLAFLMDTTQQVVNEFDPNTVPVDIVEDFENDVKENVKIQNKSEIKVYVRVDLIPTWQDKDGNVVGVSASLSDLNITWGDGFATNWKQGQDGFYYYLMPLEPNDDDPDTVTDITTALIKEATVKTENGYKMNLQVITQSIQAEGINSTTNHPPVVDMWESVTAVASNGKLTVQ